jgi:membrane protease subunit HflK
MARSGPNPVLESLEAVFRWLPWVAGAAGLLILASGITVVRPDEVALRLRFGRLTGATAADRVHGPGLLISWPYLVDEVVRVPVRRIQELRIDVLTTRMTRSSDRMDVTREGYALTGDENIVQPAAVLKYQIADPVMWVLRVVDPVTVVRDAVVAALTGTLAEMSMDAVLGEGRSQLAATALARAQARLDQDGHWVRLQALEFTAIRPPQQVSSFFDEVQSAFVEKKTRVDEARSFREQAVPRATAEAERLIRQAEAEEATRVAAARGDTGRFLAIHEAYRKSPAVVRQRLYREAIDASFSALRSRVLVPPGLSAWRLLIPADSGPAGSTWIGPEGH